MNKLVNQLAMLLVVIGALNWGLIGLVEYNVVKTLFGGFEWLERAVYILVGVAGIWLAISQITGELER
jgi:uncharacterized membrane protein YuzA (DUF378 family)